MGTAQRRVLIIAGVVALLMLLFPPWETLGGHYLGHSPIMAPPAYTDSETETHRWALPSPEPIARVSLGILSLQCAALWIGAGAVFFLVGRLRPR